MSERRAKIKRDTRDYKPGDLTFVVDEVAPALDIPSVHKANQNLLAGASRSAALQAFLPLHPYTVRRPVPVKP